MTQYVAIIWLGWACYAGAAAMLIVYAVLFARGQGWTRPWNAAGLVFTSIALSQTPSLFRNVYNSRELFTAATVTACLLAAGALQAVAALRARKEIAAEAPPVAVAVPVEELAP